MCKEIQRLISLWLGESVDDNSVDYVFSTNALFSPPMSYNSQINIFTPQLYCDTGKFVAKIMMDLHQEYGCMTFRPSNSGPSHSGPLFRGPELFAVQAHFFAIQAQTIKSNKTRRISISNGVNILSPL